MRIPSILLLCFLSLWAVSHSLPAPSNPLQQAKGSLPMEPRLEKARLMWNGARKTMRRIGRRTTRSVENDRQLLQPDEEIPNIAGEKFITDLYKNITNSTVQRNTQANTIRSLHYNEGEYLA